MAQRATSLGPKPSYLLFCFFFCFFSFCFVFCFGGFKGQVRWPKGPPHLALNPPYLLFFVFFGLLLFLSFFCFVIQKNLVLPLEKGIFCLFLSVSLCFSLAFLGLPLFSISLSLSLSSSCPCFLSFLSFFFAFFCFLVLSLFFPFLSSLLLFHEKNNMRIFHYKVFLHQYFLFFGFLSSFLFEIPFFLSLFLLLI